MRSGTTYRATLIRIAAAVLLRPDGKILLVRKRGPSAFMQPGGKIAAGETAMSALRRELEEELLLVLPEGATRHLGQFAAPAANEPGATVEAEVYVVQIDTDVAPAAEIEEICWVEPRQPGAIELAPLTRDHILPAWIAHADG